MMDQQTPEYLRPALITGAVAGLLSGLPLVNCLCCLWIIGGAAMAARLLSQGTSAVLSPSDGAVVGALTGIVAAVVQTLVSLAFKPDPETVRRVLDSLSNIGLEVPSNLDSFLESSAHLSPAWVLLGLFLTAAIFAVMGILGGVVGVSIFAKRPAPPRPPLPPSSGPTDAA